jgi:hypothetical protein
MMIFVVAIFVLILLVGVGIFIALFDWRKWAMSRWGNRPEIGLVRVKVGNTWKSYPSRARPFSKTTIATTYVCDDGSGVDWENIVPHDIGFEYDERTGRRIYEMQLGGSVATAYNSHKPMTDLPANLLAAHSMANAFSGYAHTIAAPKKSNAGMWIVIVLILGVVILGGIFIYSKFGTKPAPTPAVATQTTPPTTTAEFGGQ